MSGKLKENDERVARMKEMLSKGGGKPLIMPAPKPKPKPKPKPEPVANQDTPPNATTSANANPDRSLSSSPDRHLDPGSIVLNTDSLRQFSEKFDYDFDAVTRHQILDNSALIDRAALSQSKGLQNRRLPSSVASKLPEDYSSRRRAHTYVAPSSSMKRSATQPLNGGRNLREETDGGTEVTEEERRQKNLAKLGIQQSNNPLSALGSILKRNSAGRGSLPRKSSKKLFDSPQSSPKTKKKTPFESPPAVTRYGSEPPESKSPKTSGLFKGLRRSGSKGKKKGGDGDDNRSETGSLLSLPIQSALDEHSEDLLEPQIKAESSKKECSPSSRPYNMPSTVAEPVANGNRTPPTQVTPQRVPLRGGGSSSMSAHRKTTDSAIFKEEAYESIFSTATDSLFDSSELDKLLGKKKEKTPERTLDDGAAEARKKEDDNKLKPSAMKKSVSEYNVRSNGYLAGNSVLLPSKVDSKKSSERKRSIKDQLHRYESYSKASKTSDTPSTPVDISPPKDSMKKDELFEVPPSKQDEAPLVVEEKKESETIQEEEEEVVPSTEKDTSPTAITDGASKEKSNPEVKVTTEKEESVVETPKEKPAKVPSTGLFADLGEDEDDLFATSSTSQKAAKGKAKNAALFSDDEDVGEDKPKEKKVDVVETPCVKNEPISDPLGAGASQKPLEEETVQKVKESSNSQKDDSEKSKDDDDSLFSSPQSTPKEKKKSLFDDIDFEEPPLFKINIRSKRKTGRNPKVEDDEDLFGRSKSTTVKAKPEVLEEKTASVPEDQGGAVESIPATDEKKPDEVSDADVTVSDKSSSDTVSPKPVEEALVEKPAKPTEKLVKPAPKPAKKPVIPADAQGSAKPSWMSELKKRKQDKDGDQSSSAQKKKEPEVAEWQKKAMEREKKVETSKSSLLARRDVKKSPSSVRKSPLTNRKDNLEKSPKYSRKSDETKEEEEVKAQVNGISEEKQDSNLENVKDDKAKATEVKSPYKSRRQREREAKELEEKETKLTEGKSEATDSPPARSTYKTRQAREKEEKQNEEKNEERPRYKTRREREREAKEKEEKEAKEKESQKEDIKVESPYKTRRQREREEKEKGAGQESLKEVEQLRYKTRRQREREAKEKEEQEKLAKEKEAKEKEEKEKLAKEKEEKEKEAKEKEEKERLAKEKEEKEKEAKEKEEKEKLAKEKEEKEKEAKEKEEKERLAKEKEVIENREQGKTTKENTVKEDSSSSNSPKNSPSRRPPLKKKPSIEIISRKLRSQSKSSDPGADDAKSSSVANAKSAKKENGDMDDDVFTPDAAKAPTHIEALRVTSPTLSVEVVSTSAESPLNAKQSVESTSDSLDVKIDDFEKVHLASPRNLSSTSSPKSSVSSDKDFNEPRPFRSHTISSSRSPTPPGSSTTKLSDQVPEWKRKLMEKKRSSGSSPVHKTLPSAKAEPSSASDGKIPPWKKELMAKKKNQGNVKEDGPRSSRSVTVSTAGYSKSPKPSGRRSKDPAPTPDFMKEFQKKKMRSNQ